MRPTKKVMLNMLKRTYKDSYTDSIPYNMFMAISKEYEEFLSKVPACKSHLSFINLIYGKRQKYGMDYATFLTLHKLFSAYYNSFYAEFADDIVEMLEANMGKVHFKQFCKLTNKAHGKSLRDNLLGAGYSPLCIVAYSFSWIIDETQGAVAKWKDVQSKWVKFFSETINK